MSGAHKLITLDRLHVVLEAYGAEPGRWPAEERAGAIALIESSAEARALFEDAAALDDLLDRSSVPAVSPAHVRRVRRMESPPRHWRIAAILGAIGDWLQPGSRFAWQRAVAAAAVIGLVAGIGFSEVVLDHEVPTPRTAMAQRMAPPPVILATGIDGSGTAGAGSLTLEQDVTALSLTGGDGTDSGTAYDGEDSEVSVASIPLY